MKYPSIVSFFENGRHFRDFDPISDGLTVISKYAGDYSEHRINRVIHDICHSIHCKTGVCPIINIAQLV